MMLLRDFPLVDIKREILLTRTDMSRVSLVGVFFLCSSQFYHELLIIFMQAKILQMFFKYMYLNHIRN